MCPRRHWVAIVCSTGLRDDRGLSEQTRGISPFGDVRALPGADEQGAVSPVGGGGQVVALAQDVSEFLSSQSCRRSQERRRRPRWVRRPNAPLSLGTLRARISRARVEWRWPIFAAIFLMDRRCRRPCSIFMRSASVGQIAFAVPLAD